MNQFFAENAEKDKDELMDELNEMMAMDEMDALDVGTNVIAQDQQQQIAQPKKQEEVEADAEAELERMMAI